MTGKGYRIRLVRDGEEFEAEGDRKFVLDMLRRFDSGDGGADLARTKPPTGDGKSAVVEPKAGKGKTLSVGEFIRQLGLKKHTDIALAFGYYLEVFGGQKDFTPADINNCYYEAKMEASNTSQMIIQNIKRGLLMPSKGQSGKKKRYTLTQSGLDYIKSGGKKSSK